MDFTTIGEVLGLATSAVGITGKAADTIASIKGLFEGGKTPDNTEAMRLLNALATELTAANMTNVQLSTALKALSQEWKRQDEFESEKARYELFETGQKDIVFRLREDKANGQPPHFICPVCLNTGKLISFITGENDYKTCQGNNSHVFRFKNTPIREYSMARTKYDVFKDDY